MIEIITPPVADETKPLEHGLVVLTESIFQIDPDKVAHGALGGAFGYGANWDNDVFTMRPQYWGDCDCGWMVLEDEWSDKHKHAHDCYWNVARSAIEESPLEKVREDALRARDRHRWGSRAADEAQKLVDKAYAEHDAFKQKVYRDLCERHGIPWNDGVGCAVHCTCDHDRLWQEFIKEHPGHKPACSLELPNFLHKQTGLEVRWYKWIGRDTEAKNAAGVDLQSVFAECLASLQKPDAVHPVKPAPQQGLPGEPNPSSDGETG